MMQTQWTTVRRGFQYTHNPVCGYTHPELTWQHPFEVRMQVAVHLCFQRQDQRPGSTGVSELVECGHTQGVYGHQCCCLAKGGTRLEQG
jgi:hypothetical protein